MNRTANLTDPMNLEESLETLLSTTLAEVAAAPDVAALDAVEAGAVGRESPIGDARRGLGKMPQEERRDAGRLINDVARQIEQAIAARRGTLAAEARSAAIVAEAVDVTVDHVAMPVGRVHPIQQVVDEICDIFIGLGYHIAEGPEAELAWYNFDALNTPVDHPGRLESDTMYLDYGRPEDEMLLRSHTSPVQARYMEKTDPPVYIVAPGKTYRNDTVDATHLPVFHQIEGLAVDESITFSDLKGTLAEFARHVFGSGTRVRLRPHFVPFTEPSAELDVSCFNCDGGEATCRVCKGVGWLEMLGCGMVDPRVFEAVGYDPEVVTGFAFGMGVERLAMLRYGVKDLRMFFDNDLRFLEQFR